MATTHAARTAHHTVSEVWPAGTGAGNVREATSRRPGPVHALTVASPARKRFTPGGNFRVCPTWPGAESRDARAEVLPSSQMLTESRGLCPRDLNPHVSEVRVGSYIHAGAHR